jgi:hypothetical protein
MAFAGATLTLPCQFIRESDARSTRLDRQFVTGEVAVPMVPKRALTLAQELLTRGVQAIKADQWGGE